MKTKFDSVKAGGGKAKAAPSTPASRGPARNASAPNKGKPAAGTKPPPFSVKKTIASKTAKTAPRAVFKAEGGDITTDRNVRALGDTQKFVHPRKAGEVVAGAINRVFARAGKSDEEKQRLDEKARKAKKDLGY